MKKTILLMAAATVALCLSSCKKDEPTPSPNPSPAKHLAQILYIDDEEVASDPYETWNWECDQLNDITYHWLTNGNNPVVETFTYQNNHIISSEISGGDLRISYGYDGDHLVRMKTSDGTYSYSFAYEGDKLKTMVMTTRYVSDRDIYSFTRNYDFTWDGDNIVKVEMELRTDGSVTYTTVTEMTYDNSHNPYYGIGGYLPLFMSERFTNFSANNMLTYRSVTTYPDSKLEEEYRATRTYTYSDDNYPVKVVEDYVTPEGSRIKKYAYRYTK